jgi:putative transposase
MCRTYRYLLQPTGRQKVALEQLLAAQCELYNAALEDRRGAWRWEHRSVSYVDQCRTLTALRDVRPDVLACGVTVCRGTLKRLDRSFSAFYRRCRAGEAPGFPRFKPRSRWDSVQWEDTSGWRVIEASGRLHLLGIGHVKIRLHRALRGTPKAITVAREGRRWWLSVRCVDVPAEPLAPTGREIGIDLGVISTVTTSDGEHVTNPRYFTSAQERLARAQQALATKRRGSARRRRQVERVAALHRKTRNQRRDFAHQLSRQLVNHFDLIVTEDLRVANMVRRPKPVAGDDGGFLPNGASAKSGLNRSIHDAGWQQLTAMISYKAESAGRTHLVVNPAHTSMRCHECGHTEAGNRPSQAVFECRSCGHRDHADANAAKNILRAGRAQRASARAGSN